MDRSIALLNSGTTYSLVPERAATKRDRRRAVRAYSRMFFALAVFQIVGQLSVLVIQVALILMFGEEYAADLFENPYVQMGMQVLCMYVLAFPAFLLCCLGLPKSKHVKSKMSFGEMLVLVLFGQACMSLVNLVTQPIISIFEEMIGYTEDPALDAMVMNTPIWLIIAVMVIIGPIIEELMFRKILFDRMSVYGDRLAILVTSVAFGLFHANLYQLFYTACFGFVLGYAYARTRRIKYPIILHMIANFLGTIPALLLSDYVLNVPEIDPGTTITPEMAEEVLVWFGATLTLLFTNYGLALAGIITVIVLLILGKVHIPKTREVRLPLYTLPRVTIFNLGAIIFGVVILALIVLPYAVALMPAG